MPLCVRSHEPCAWLALSRHICYVATQGLPALTIPCRDRVRDRDIGSEGLCRDTNCPACLGTLSRRRKTVLQRRARKRCHNRETLSRHECTAVCVASCHARVRRCRREPGAVVVREYDTVVVRLTLCRAPSAVAVCLALLPCAWLPVTTSPVATQGVLSRQGDRDQKMGSSPPFPLLCTSKFLPYISPSAIVSIKLVLTV